MLKAPEKYLQSILSKSEIDKDLSKLILYFILNSNKNIHFIVDEKEINIQEIICKISLQKYNSNNVEFEFGKGQKIISLQSPQSGIFVISDLHPQPELKYELLKEKDGLNERRSNIDNFIPLSNSSVQSLGIVQNRITEYKEIYSAKNGADFFSNEKLLVVGNLHLFNEMPKSYPACFVSENGTGDIEIKYNSPLLPKITILKNINLLERYLEEEINGKNISFNMCVFIGSPKFEHSINTIRNCYSQKNIPRIIFIGDKDVKIDLGNNQIPLRWKWTIPEINYFKNRQTAEHDFIVVQNNDLENAINQFYQIIREIEVKHTVNLKSIFRFVRKLYYDWSLKSESNLIRLKHISDDFGLALKELLEETFFNIDPDFDTQIYYNTLVIKFSKIISTVKINNKTEKIKTYQRRIHQLVSPSFLCSDIKTELNYIFAQTKKQTRKLETIGHNLESLKDFEAKRKQHCDNSKQNYFSLTADQTKTEIVSFSKSDNANGQYHKLISSIYGNGKIEKLISRLGQAKTQYTLLLYSIEKKAFDFYIDKYVEELNREYMSDNRYQICGIEFNDTYYQFSTFDQLIESLATIHDDKEIEFYKITFADNSKPVKLPSTKSVLRIHETEKIIINVEDLDIGDNVQVYENTDKETLRTIFELKHSDLVKRADEYSALWNNCLLNYYTSSLITEETLHSKLTNNGFSVSISTMRKYLKKEVEFPRARKDLIAIAKTVNDDRLCFNFVKNTILPFLHDYEGKRIEYGRILSESINNYLITGEMDEFIVEWYTKEEVGKIVSQIPVKTIKGIEFLITKDNSDD